MKFGSKVGAAFGGALGVAASPLVVPGLALAALLGGAGGYQWAKYWGSQDCMGCVWVHESLKLSVRYEWVSAMQCPMTLNRRVRECERPSTFATSVRKVAARSYNMRPATVKADFPPRFLKWCRFCSWFEKSGQVNLNEASICNPIRSSSSSPSSPSSLSHSSSSVKAKVE